MTTITANDVDTDPPLTYDLKNGGEAFAMDRFTGMLTLLRPLDYETESEFHLYVTASDSAHTAETLVRVRVRDENDNAPVFSQHAYIVPIPGEYFGSPKPPAFTEWHSHTECASALERVQPGDVQCDREKIIGGTTYISFVSLIMFFLVNRIFRSDH